MIIKDLWIISRSGLSLYHYQASFSDYQLDDSLFAGFISALSTFAESLSKKRIDFLKLEEDEIYFASQERIIIVSIINTSGSSTEEHIIEQLLHFVGEKFIELFGQHLDKTMFDFETISENFNKEIEFITADDEIYEELKREMINKLLTEIVIRKKAPDVLTWKVASLFQNSTPEEIQKTIEMLDNLKSVLSTMTDDVVLESQLMDVIARAIFQLKHTLLRDEKKKQLYVLCDEILFNNIFQNFITFGTACSHFKTVDDINSTIKAVEKYYTDLSYNILIEKPTINKQEAKTLTKIKTSHSIVIWIDKIKPGIKKIIAPHSNIGLHFGYCDLYEGCPKIVKILNMFDIPFNS